MGHGLASASLARCGLLYGKRRSGRSGYGRWSVYARHRTRATASRSPRTRYTLTNIAHARDSEQKLMSTAEARDGEQKLTRAGTSEHRESPSGVEK